MPMLMCTPPIARWLALVWRCHGVLARALAPREAARFEALSEFQQALRQPLRQPWHLAALALLVVQLAVGLWLSLVG